MSWNGIHGLGFGGCSYSSKQALIMAVRCALFLLMLATSLGVLNICGWGLKCRTAFVACLSLPLARGRRCS